MWHQNLISNKVTRVESPLWRGGKAEVSNFRSLSEQNVMFIISLQWKVNFFRPLSTCLIPNLSVSFVWVNNCIELSGRWVPGMSRGLTVTSQPIDSKTLPWLAIPATQPFTGTSRHPSHCDNSGKRDKKKQKGEWKGGRKLRKHYRWRKDNRLEKTKGCTTLFPLWFQIAATLNRMTYMNLSTYAWDRWLLSNRFILDPNAQENQHLFVVN